MRRLINHHRFFGDSATIIEPKSGSTISDVTSVLTASCLTVEHLSNWAIGKARIGQARLVHEVHILGRVNLLVLEDIIHGVVVPRIVRCLLFLFFDRKLRHALPGNIRTALVVRTHSTAATRRTPVDVGSLTRPRDAAASGCIGSRLRGSRQVASAVHGGLGNVDGCNVDAVAAVELFQCSVALIVLVTRKSKRFSFRCCEALAQTVTPVRHVRFRAIDRKSADRTRGSFVISFAGRRSLGTRVTAELASHVLANCVLGPSGDAGVLVVGTPRAASAHIEVQRVVVDADTRDTVGAGNLDQFQPLGLGETRHVNIKSVAVHVLGLLRAASLLVALGVAISRYDIEFATEVLLGLLPLRDKVLVDLRHIHGETPLLGARANRTAVSVVGRGLI